MEACLALFVNEDIKPSTDSGGSIAFEVEDLDALSARLKSGPAVLRVDDQSTLYRCRGVRSKMGSAAA